MCGITGFFDTTCSTSAAELNSIATRMSDTIRHRGPDDQGAWVDAGAGIALGFRRLAILDLSPTGHQPMSSSDGRFVIIFNGEIYNYSILRAELLAHGHGFRGSSDTEVMLAAIQHWGLQAAVQRFNGMFAFALYDRRDQTISLVRDRLGIKPLYYGWANNILLFGSELKSLRAHPEFHAGINREGLALFMRFSYIPAPHTIYQNFYKLLPGCILTVRSGTNPKVSEPEPYWSVNEIVQNGLSNPFQGSETEAIDELENSLTKSIGLRMVADVPLGAFLSGGVDSSTVVALMQKQSNKPVRTFTIGFDEAGFDEASHAKEVANHLGTDHTELYIGAGETRAVIPLLPRLYDEPFADPSQIPTYLVSHMARQHVTVSLSGDGGDELFGGYNRYTWVERIHKRTSFLPSAVRSTLASGLGYVKPGVANRVVNWVIPGMPNASDKIQKLAEVLSAGGPDDIFVDLVSHWKNPSSLVIDGREPLTRLTDRKNWIKTSTFSELMMALDLVSYLPDNVLSKVDRASMGSSLEVRAPFLDDHQTVEFAWQLPLPMKIRANQGKWILRQVLYRYVPAKLIERPKMGFGVPIDSWLRGPLRSWAGQLLDNTRLQSEGYFNPQEIQKKWVEHTAGVKNWQYDLWNVLMFQAWLEETNP